MPGEIKNLISILKFETRVEWKKFVIAEIFLNENGTTFLETNE
jgi:hypothetical protein